jgi:hypothetical protein
MADGTFTHRTEVAHFGDNALDFILDDTEDKKCIRGSLAVLSGCARSLTRIIRIAEATEKLPDDGDTDILENSRIGLEFITSVCACLASTLDRMGDDDVDQ